MRAPTQKRVRGPGADGRPSPSKAPRGGNLLMSGVLPFGRTLLAAKARLRKDIAQRAHTARQRAAQIVRSACERAQGGMIRPGLIRAACTPAEGRAVAYGVDQLIRRAAALAFARDTRRVGDVMRVHDLAAVLAQPWGAPGWVDPDLALECGVAPSALRLALPVPPVHNVVTTGNVGESLDLALLVACFPMRSRCGPRVGPGPAVRRDANQSIGIDGTTALALMKGGFNDIGARNLSQGLVAVVHYVDMLSPLLVLRPADGTCVRACDTLDAQRTRVCNTVATVTMTNAHGIDIVAMARALSHSGIYDPTSCPSFHLAVPAPPWNDVDPPHPADTRLDHVFGALARGAHGLRPAQARTDSAGPWWVARPIVRQDALLFDTGNATLMAGVTRPQQAYAAAWTTREAGMFPDPHVPMRSSARSRRRMQLFQRWKRAPPSRAPVAPAPGPAGEGGAAAGKVVAFDPAREMGIDLTSFLS